MKRFLDFLYPHLLEHGEPQRMTEIIMKRFLDFLYPHLKELVYFVLGIICLSLLLAADAPAQDQNPPLKPEAMRTALPKVNINTATASELTTLNGIGKVKAQRIVDYRIEVLKLMKENKVNEPVFKEALDLTNVKGIGKKTVEKNLRLIILK